MPHLDLCITIEPKNKRKILSTRTAQYHPPACSILYVYKITTKSKNKCITAIYTHTISAIYYREYSGAGKSISRTERPSDRVEGGWQLTRKGFNLSWGCPAELNNLDDGRKCIVLLLLFSWVFFFFSSSFYFLQRGPATSLLLFHGINPSSSTLSIHPSIHPVRFLFLDKKETPTALLDAAFLYIHGYTHYFYCDVLDIYTHSTRYCVINTRLAKEFFHCRSVAIWHT